MYLRGVYGQKQTLPNQADTLILKVVRALSNFRPKTDGPAAAGSCEHRPAFGHEVRDAIALILWTGGQPGGADQVREFLDFAAYRRINLANLWVLTCEGRTVWAALPIVSPGRTTLLLIPPIRPAGIDVGPIIEGVCNQLASGGVHLAQVLLDPADTAARTLFADHRFREMAELLYLQTGVRRTRLPPAIPPGMTLRSYSPQTHELFVRAVGDSYQQSLDCPGLNGLREIDDVLTGHKASGEFDPRFWFVLCRQGSPIAVLLLNRVPRSDTAELVYLGLVPPFRGRGLGNLMLRHALHCVRQIGLERLSLAVDANNAPALNLYYRHGLQRVGSKIAMMRDLRETGEQLASQQG